MPARREDIILGVLLTDTLAGVLSSDILLILILVPCASGTMVGGYMLMASSAPSMNMTFLVQEALVELGNGTAQVIVRRDIESHSLD